MFETQAAYVFHTSAFQVFAGTCILLLSWTFFKTLQLAFSRSLRKIPGPHLSAFTVWPLRSAVLSGRRTLYIHALHKKFGPFVRIGPSEISIADFSAWRHIHRPGSDFRKNPAWYQGQSPVQYDDDTCGVFGLVDPKVASMRRRLFLTAGTRKIISEWEPQVVQLVNLTVRKMKEDLEMNGTCDVMKWWTLQAADVSAELAFGDGFSNVANGKKSEMIEDIEATMPLIGLRLELPLLYEIFMSLPLPASRKFKELFKRYEVYGARAISNTRNASKGLTKTLFSRMVPEDGTQYLPDSIVEKEAANVLIAGTDTTAMTLIYLTYAVLKDEAIKSRLMQEIKTVPDWPTWEQLEGLPLLHNIIRETWRRYPAIPGSLSRVVPAGGVQFGDYKIPEGTVVSTQAYTFHLDPTVFPDPLEFNPDRWIDPTPEMKERIMVFGGPARLCVGQNIAKLQLFHSVFKFFRECGETNLAASTTEESMGMVDYFTIKPVADECVIVPAK